jgi:hypothetical protein
MKVERFDILLSHRDLLLMLFCVEQCSDNFIKMDIFYQDLTHNTVATNVGFELSSLFSEIGSLMGLLLGASLLTACELVDYLWLLMLVKCTMRRHK